MHYRLRTLLVVLICLPMLTGEAVNLAQRVVEARERARRMMCNNRLTLYIAGPESAYAAERIEMLRHTNAVWRLGP